MPKFEIEYKVNIGSLLNAVLLVLGIAAGAFAWFSDQKAESQAVKMLEQKVQVLQTADQQISGKITEAQERTTNRLSTLETQNQFILRALDRLETALARRPQ